MTADLIDRLRAVYESETRDYELAGQAADEIARLRALLAEVVAVMGWYERPVVVPDQLADRLKAVLEEAK